MRIAAIRWVRSERSGDRRQIWRAKSVLALYMYILHFYKIKLRKCTVAYLFTLWLPVVQWIRFSSAGSQKVYDPQWILLDNIKNVKNW